MSSKMEIKGICLCKQERMWRTLPEPSSLTGEKCDHTKNIKHLFFSPLADAAMTAAHCCIRESTPGTTGAIAHGRDVGGLRAAGDWWGDGGRRWVCRCDDTVSRRIVSARNDRSQSIVNGLARVLPLMFFAHVTAEPDEAARPRAREASPGVVHVNLSPNLRECWRKLG